MKDRIVRTSISNMKKQLEEDIKSTNQSVINVQFKMDELQKQIDCEYKCRDELKKLVARDTELILILNVWLDKLNKLGEEVEFHEHIAKMGGRF